MHNNTVTVSRIPYADGVCLGVGGYPEHAMITNHIQSNHDTKRERYKNRYKPTSHIIEPVHEISNDVAF